MSEFAHETPESSDRTELFTLLSRQHDGDLEPADFERLVSLESSHREAAESFRRQAEKLSSLLKRIPIRAPERLLYESPTMSVSLATFVPDRERLPRRSVSQRAVVSLVTSLLCAGLLLALIQRPEATDSTILAKSERLHGTLEARAGNASRGFGAAMMEDGGMAADSVPMAVAGSVPPNVLLGAAAANAKAADSTSFEDSSESDIQPLIQSDDWNVVVVRIDGKDRDQAVDQIQSIVKKAGLRLQSTAGNDESRWLGVVLTSNVAGREDVVTAMEEVGESSGYAVDTPPADSQEAVFIAAARESLKHPTRSELHHGKVFVALPSSSQVKDEEQIASLDKHAAGGGDVNSRSPGQSEEPSPSKPSAAVSAKAVPAVTLVVFDFSEGDKSGPNNSGQQI